MVIEIDSRRKQHFIDPKDLISIITPLDTFELALDMKRIQEKSAMWVIPHFVIETLANELNSSMCARKSLVLLLRQ